MMRIGTNNGPLDDDILALGFTVVDSMKILGILIDCKAEKLGENFDACIRKMRTIVANWSRFRLSLPGKIAIAKSMLISQLTYPGTIFSPSVIQLREMNELIESFVTSNTVIARDRIYLSVKDGGLGMIKLDDFLTAQKCGWIRRLYSAINDPWRWEFLQRSNYDLESVRIEFFDQGENPLLYAIASAVCKFQVKYWATNENYLTAPIFNNEFFLREKPRARAAVPQRIDLSLLRRRIRDEYVYQLLGLKMCVMFDANDSVVSYETLCRTSEIPFSVNEYFILRTAALYAREKYGNKATSNGKCLTLQRGVY
jgi:hypothetical protein